MSTIERNNPDAAIAEAELAIDQGEYSDQLGQILAQLQDDPSEFLELLGELLNAR